MKWFIRVVFLTISLSASTNGLRPTNLKVVNKPKEIISLEVSPVVYGSYVSQGTLKKYNCKASSRYQKLEWYSPSGEVVPHDPSNRVHVQEHVESHLKNRVPTLVLVFTKALVEDSGVWECRSGDLKKETPVCVLDPTEFLEMPSEVTVDEGRSFTLSCQVRGEPEPIIRWFKDRHRLYDDDTKFFTSVKYNRQGFEGLLTIKSLTPDDSGSYLCLAEQEFPGYEECFHHASTNITLSVNHRPKFETKSPVLIYAQNNESVEVICAPSAYPSPTYRWFKEAGEMLIEYPEDHFRVSDDDSHSNMTIVANSSTFGQRFQCQAENTYGSATLIFELLMLQKPSRIDEISLSNATNRMIEFNVTWYDNGLFPVDGCDVQYFEKISAGTPKEFEWRRAKFFSYEFPTYFETKDYLVPIDNLKEETEYWVRLRGSNKLGKSPWSVPILASTVSAEEMNDAKYDEVVLPEAGFDYGALVGFVLLGVIMVVISICMIIIKRL